MAAPGNPEDDAPSPSPYSDNYLAVFAATTIQRWFRGFRVRKAFREQRSRINRVQLEWASHHDVAYRNDKAARIIQNAWRSYRNRRIYHYYRDLIRFRERGDPRELLRVVNPREASLVDAAAGIHVRFRLGGTTFPPLVFYKIFTHRPVADICAFGPRDYANEIRMTPGELHNNRPTQGSAAAGAGAAGPSAGMPAGVARLRGAGGGAAGGSGPGSPKLGVGFGSSVGGGGSAPGSGRQSPDRLRGAGAAGASGAGGQGQGQGGSTKKKHTYREESFELDKSYREYIKPDGTIGWRSTVGWYERHENNGWRPVAERVLLDEDPVTTMTRLKRQPMFHHNPAVRREERARRIKEKKREWLRKVYLQGGPGAAGGNGAPGSAALEALYGKLDSDLAGMGLDELDDGQLDDKADELLNWSQHLDFGSYFDDWTSTACTLASEAFVPEEEAPYLDEIPNTYGDVRREMAAAGVPLAPFKGGTSAACGTIVRTR